MTALSRTGLFLRGLRGWRRALCAFGAGAVSALGFAPVEFFPALLLGFAVLLLLLDGVAESLPVAFLSPAPFAGLTASLASYGISPSGVLAHARGRRAGAGFACGWAFAFGQYLVGWHWVGYAFMVDPSAHLWQMPFALVFLTGGLALWAGLACGAALFVWREGAARILVFAVFYAAGEWLRGHAFTGFPWNLPAYGWGVSLAILQSASVLGAYGLSFLTILLGASLACLCGPRRGFVLPAVTVLLFAGLWGAGQARLSAHGTGFVPGVQLRLVQPDIPQAEKYKPRFLARNWERLLDLSMAPGPRPTHIIWPEAAPPFVLSLAPSALDEIALLTGRGRSLITGAERIVRRGPQSVSFYNSLYIFGPGGRQLAVYDKFHLVPFGEYVPFARLFAHLGITKLTAGEAGFSAGDGPHTYDLSGTGFGAPPVGPLICYEVIFPGAVTGKVRPAWLVNVTDDSWFGPWAGPRQHLLIARVRAIEEALPLVRDANTGISAVIDPYGRIIARLGLGRMGVVDARLPKAAPASTYARYGDWTFALLLISALFLAFVPKRK